MLMMVPTGIPYNMWGRLLADQTQVQLKLQNNNNNSALKDGE